MLQAQSHPTGRGTAHPAGPAANHRRGQFRVSHFGQSLVEHGRCLSHCALFARLAGALCAACVAVDLALGVAGGAGFFRVVTSVQRGLATWPGRACSLPGGVECAAPGHGGQRVPTKPPGVATGPCRRRFCHERGAAPTGFTLVPRMAMGHPLRLAPAKRHHAGPDHLGTGHRTPRPTQDGFRLLVARPTDPIAPRETKDNL